MIRNTPRSRPRILCETFEANGHIVAWFQHGCKKLQMSDIPQLPTTLERGITVAICTYKRAASLDRFLESLSNQNRMPDRVLIVDASSDDETEQVVRAQALNRCRSLNLLYCRVNGPLKGLTHQRNFALRLVATDLVAFFDDDVTLHTQCLAAMEQAYLSDQDIVGVGAAIENAYIGLDWTTRLRLLFGIIPRGPRGRYHRSGFQTSWYPLPHDDAVVEGDYLHGCGMMWKTAVARDVGFFEGFNGYSQGEDLDFSLRMRCEGKLVMASGAQLRHLHEDAGRPDPRQQGYMLIRNLFKIHCRAFPNHRWRDVCWFAFAWTLDTILLLRHFLFPNRIRSTLEHILGRLVAAFDIITRRRSNLSQI